MTAIWQNDGSRWHLLSPTGFPNEATLHTLVEQAPHLLPLAGTPSTLRLRKIHDRIGGNEQRRTGHAETSNQSRAE